MNSDRTSFKPKMYFTCDIPIVTAAAVVKPIMLRGMMDWWSDQYRVAA